MGGFGHRGEVADAAQNVGILHHDAGRVLVDPGDQPVQIRLSGDGRHGVGDRVTGEMRHGLHDLRIVGVQRARENRALTLGYPGCHRHRLPARGRPVIERGIGHGAAIEPRDLRLEFEQHLQRALRDFRLVGRVGRQELAALDDGVDAGGDMVAIGPRAEEERHFARHEVLGRQGFHVAFDRHFARMHRKAVDRAIEPGDFGHVHEQIINRGGADGRQHRLPVGIGEGEVTHGVQPRMERGEVECVVRGLRRRPCSHLRPSARQARLRRQWSS